jgi:hypothetical protein
MRETSPSSRRPEATPLRTGHLLGKNPDAKARMQQFMRERYRD